MSSEIDGDKISATAKLGSVIDRLKLRTIKEDDFFEIKELHEELFPVRYGDAFYQDAVRGLGMGGGELFTLLAIDNERIVGFIFAQVIITQRNEDKDLFLSGMESPEICYILTLGVKQEYRRAGLAHILVSKCIDFAKSNKSCGLVFLHVIHYNYAAINFYEKNRFERVRELRGVFLGFKYLINYFIIIVYTYFILFYYFFLFYELFFVSNACFFFFQPSTQ